MTVALTIVAAGCGAPGVTPYPAASQTPTVSAAVSPPSSASAGGIPSGATLVDNCYPVGPNGLYQPASLTLTCADGNTLAEQMMWSSWTASQAEGTGVISKNDCTPDCANGHFHSYPAEFVLEQPLVRAGSEVFSVIVVTYTGEEPSGQRTESYPL